MMAEEIVSLGVSIAGNLALGGMFLAALLSPREYGDFVFRTGMLFFLIEFLSLHSSGMAFGARKKEQGRDDAKTVFHFSAKGPGAEYAKKNPKLVLSAGYTLFVIVLGLIFRNLYLPAYFLVSLLAKFFGKNASPTNTQVGLPILLFLVTTFFAVLTASFFAKIFPIPLEILQYRMPNTSGLFVDHPQAVMIWGITYFASLTIAEVVLSLRGKS